METASRNDTNAASRIARSVGSATKTGAASGTSIEIDTSVAEPHEREAPDGSFPGRFSAWVRLPPAVLALVACGHFLGVACADLSPWLGGGFGMFADVDVRRLIAFEEPAHTEVAIPSALEDAAERARALPTDRRLRALARQISGDVRGAISVEVWRDRLDSRSLRPAPELLRRAVAGRGG